MTTEMRFIITSQHRRFAEICNKSLNSKFISLFYGKTGLGKTECALQYANWRIVEPLLDRPAMTRRPPSWLGDSEAVTRGNDEKVLNRYPRHALQTKLF